MYRGPFYIEALDELQVEQRVSAVGHVDLLVCIAPKIAKIRRQRGLTWIKELNTAQNVTGTEKLDMKASFAITPQYVKAACSQCNLRELCLPFGLAEHGSTVSMNSWALATIKVKRQAQLYRAGDPFNDLCDRTGSFKTDVLLEDRRGRLPASR